MKHKIIFTKVFALVLAVSLLVSASNLSVLAESGFKTTLQGLTALQGNWTQTADGLRSQGSGDCFAISSVEATDFIFEADVKIEHGSAASLVFRSSDDGMQSYVANIDKARNDARIFRFNKGGGATTLGQLKLPDSLIYANEYHLRVEAVGDTMKYFINGLLAVSCQDTTYKTGKLGLLTFDATIIYQNVNHTILEDNDIPKLEGLELVGGDLLPQFDADVLTYESIVPFSTESIRVIPTAQDCVITVGAVAQDYSTIILDSTEVVSGSESPDINLPVGVSYISVKVKSNKGIEVATTITIERKQDPDLMYKEKYRPQFHFTAEKNWINDPNGLVYDNGIYHLFYQYNPFGLDIGNQTWGHATSSDLINWEQQPIAIKPDSLGVIYSGCAVVDEDNTTGFFTDNTPDQSKLVAIFTHHGGDQTHGLEKQSLAYSKDNGMTWIKYEGNPVIPNDNNKYGNDFRDPKVFRHDGKWLMIIAGGRARLFSSDNLIDWTLESELNYKNGSAIYSECPDLFPLPVDGNPENIKWVYTGSGDFYVIGDLVKENGKYVFKATSDRIEPYNGGPEMYATQSFYNDGSGQNRRMLVSWMRDSSAGQLADEGKTWNGVQSLPLVTELRTINGEIRLTSYAPEELKNQRAILPMFKAENLKVNKDTENILSNVTADKYDIEATFTLGSATEFGFNLRTGNGQKTVVKYNRHFNLLTLDRNNSGKVLSGVHSVKLSPNGDKISLRIIVDTSVIDVFGNEGEAAICALFFPEPTSVGMEFFAVNGDVTIDSMEIYQMKSIYHDDLQVTVEMVEHLISRLPEKITLDDAEMIEIADMAYKQLSEQDRGLVSEELTYKLQMAISCLDFLNNGLKGDLNQDQALSVIDVVAMRRLIMSGTAPDPLQMLMGDLNEDDAISVIDVVALRKLIMTG